MAAVESPRFERTNVRLLEDCRESFEDRFWPAAEVPTTLICHDRANPSPIWKVFGPAVDIRLASCFRTMAGSQQLVFLAYIGLATRGDRPLLNAVRITEDSPARMVVLCNQTAWIAFLPGLVAILMAAISISQRHWALLWSTAGFALFGWFFIRRDRLEIQKISRRVTFYSLRPFGVRTTHFEFDDIKDVVFEGNGTYFRPALATSTGLFPLTAWWSQGSSRSQEQMRVRILIALGKLRPGILT